MPPSPAYAAIRSLMASPRKPFPGAVYIVSKEHWSRPDFTVEQGVPKYRLVARGLAKGQAEAAALSLNCIAALRKG